MAQGYATIANGGFAVKPYVIDAIYGAAGETLYRAEPLVACAACEAAAEAHGRQAAAHPAASHSGEPVIDTALSYRPSPTEYPERWRAINAAPRAISAQNAYLVSDMMRDVIRRGYRPPGSSAGPERPVRQDRHVQRSPRRLVRRLQRRSREHGLGRL